MQTKYFKTRTPESLKKYRKQKNYCSRLHKKECKTFFNNLKVSNITDNKTFWKNIQPISSENRKVANKITLVGNNENMISDDKLVSEELNNFFENATKTLNIIGNSYLTNNANEVLDPVDKSIFKYKNHPSILTIKNSLGVTTPFLFNEVSLADIEEELSNLNTKKSTFKNIPAKVLKISRNSCSETVKVLFNKTVQIGNFPNELK